MDQKKLSEKTLELLDAYEAMTEHGLSGTPADAIRLLVQQTDELRERLDDLELALTGITPLG